MVRHITTAVLGGTIASTAAASPELQFDINSITTRITGNSHGGAFSENFSGSLRLGHDEDSHFARILLDGTSLGFDNDLSDGDGWAMSHLSVKVNIANGTVVGGFLYLEVEKYAGGVRTSEIDTYEADIVAGIGHVAQQAGQGFRIDGLTINGMFSDSTFGGVDVSQWFNAQPLVGSFLNFSFNPGDNPLGVDTNSNIDIFITVPSPLAGLSGLAGLGILTVLRRRRLDA